MCCRPHQSTREILYKAEEEAVVNNERVEGKEEARDKDRRNVSGTVFVLDEGVTLMGKAPTHVDSQGPTASLAQS